MQKYLIHQYTKKYPSTAIAEFIVRRNVIGFGPCSKENWGLQIKTTQVIERHNLSPLLKTKIS